MALYAIPGSGFCDQCGRLASPVVLDAEGRANRFVRYECNCGYYDVPIHEFQVSASLTPKAEPEPAAEDG